MDTQWTLEAARTKRSDHGYEQDENDSQRHDGGEYLKAAVESLV